LGFFEDAGTGPVGFSFPVPAGTLEMFGDKNMGCFTRIFTTGKGKFMRNFLGISAMYMSLCIPSGKLT